MATTIRQMIERLVDAFTSKRRHPKATNWDHRAHAISWVVGSIMLDKPDYDEWILRREAVRAFDREPDSLNGR